MSAVTCDNVGTGDAEVESLSKCEGHASKNIAKDLVLEIVNNAMEKAHDSPNGTNQSGITESILVDGLKIKTTPNRGETKEKIMVPLIGTGDQRSNETLEQETLRYHPPVEKKNRLTDLVKNSKQILAKIIMTDSRSNLQSDKSPAEKKEEETIVDVIELECVQLHDIPFKCHRKILPEEVPLPKNDSMEIFPPATEEVSLQVGEPSGQTSQKSKESIKKMLTFPRVNGSKAKAAFAAKCRTLKGGISLKKKKWNVSDRIANFFKKKNCYVKEDAVKCEVVKELPEDDER